MNKSQRLISIINETDPASSMQSRIHGHERAIRDLENALAMAKDNPDKQKYIKGRIDVKKAELDALKKKNNLVKLKPANQSMAGSPGAQGNVNQLGAIPVGPLKKRKWRNK